MEKLVFHKMIDNIYIGMVTVLDYEISLKKCLSELVFPPAGNNERKVIVDLALKTGINKYRFAVFNISAEGKIAWNSSEYVLPGSNMVYLANHYLKEQSEIIENSMLPGIKKQELIS